MKSKNKYINSIILAKYISNMRDHIHTLTLARLKLESGDFTFIKY